MTLMRLFAFATTCDVDRYGGCQPSPLRQFAYICGFGGYTSLMEAAGAAAIGPTMYDDFAFSIITLAPTLTWL